MTDIGNKSLKYQAGIGPKRAELLANDMDMHVVDDMLQFYPYKYVDRSHIYKISELRADMPYVQICGRFISRQMVSGGRMPHLTATFSDGTGTIEIVWFKGLNYVTEQINPNELFLLFGKPSIFNHKLNMTHPEMEKADSAHVDAGTLQPFYNTTERMKKSGFNSKAIHKIIRGIFVDAGDDGIMETLPQSILTKCNLMPRGKALQQIHFPTNAQTLEIARYRMKFEELFYIHLSLLRNKTINRSHQQGVVFAKAGALLNDFYKNHIPFEPTNAQKKVVREMSVDMASGRQMNRLLQGDVGSGKTLVALMVMLIAAGNGYQACIMAPTEILATQHYENLSKMLSGMSSVSVALLTGSTKKKDRTKILSALADGSLNFIVGTHALIEDTVVFNKLGLAIVDEQHRFGVAQRARLWAKATIPPHILVMTATPIPRTLAMTVYGDLDVSVIDELPPGRKPVMTEHYFHNSRNSLNKFIRDQLQQGRQCYVVYPLIDESEKMDFKNLTEGFEYMKEAFPEYKVCMVHGKLSAEEKDEAMHSFASGESQIMVATTVIEVGVNVPNASIMVIESAERFGLSQLHQLRGRVGRGADQSYCVLMTSYKLSDDTRRRMEVMVGTTDGFEIAEADMRLRGPGDISGTQQSGLPFSLRIADLAKDSQLVQYTREKAQELLAADPSLESADNVVAVERLRALAKQQINWSEIS
ncbi:MAG: ATP-dependent DNA helicase RecG [Bacteroidales bacterium]|nr:ATP-dependent DNA helicase RecG [Bacteroidales bacterium]